METEFIEMLTRVQVWAIRDLLSKNGHEYLKIKSLRRSELISLVEKTSSITPQMISDLYEDFRYGKRASFYLYIFKAKPNNTEILDLELWNNTLTELQKDHPLVDLNVKVIDTAELDNNLDEIHFTFKTAYQYEEVEFGNLEMIQELNHGFLWINKENLYMVVMTRREEVNQILEKAIHKLLNCIPVAVKLPKNFVNEKFPLDDASRVSWYDSDKDVSWTASGEDLKQKEGDNILRLEAQNERLGGLYKEMIDGTRSKLGVHPEKGKIYLTKTIKASVLKRWMATRLHNLILDLKGLPPEEIILVTSEFLDGLKLTGPAETFFQEIASNIMKLKKNSENRGKLSVQPAKIYSSLRSYFYKPVISIYCEICNARSGAYCPRCEVGEFESSGVVLKCDNCGYEVAGVSTVRCSEGHDVLVSNPESKLILKPKMNMQAIVTRLIREAGDTFNENEEFFWIDSIDLRYRKNSAQIEFLADEIDEFRLLPGREPVPNELWDHASKLVLSTKEKCSYNGSNPKAPDCEECNKKNLGRLCIPKIFRAISPRFSPTPHGGSEYGDVSMPIHLRGNRKSFIGLAKTIDTSAKRKGEDKANQKAHEWTYQILKQVMRDQAVETFGLIDPIPLNTEFHDSVRMLAKMDNKPFIVFGHEELSRMLCSLLQDPNHKDLIHPLL